MEIAAIDIMYQSSHMYSVVAINGVQGKTLATLARASTGLILGVEGASWRDRGRLIT